MSNDILLDLRETVAGNCEHSWTGEDGLFARAAAEIETLRARVAELEGRPLFNPETLLSGRLNQEER